MMRSFRKYHRLIAIAVFLPLILTVITGMGYIIFEEWLGQDEIGGFILRVHTLDILGLEKIYPLLNGLGLVGLLVTGLNMTGLFNKRPKPRSAGDR